MLLTAGVALVVALTGGFLVFGHTDQVLRNLGVGLLTGSALGFAVFALQLYSDQNSQRLELRREAADRKLEERREAAAARQSFLFTLAVTSNLTGFDPRGRSLNGLYLAGKVLSRARLRGAKLRGATLRDASLVAADLSHSRLILADLINADLYQAALTGANLRGADLRFAKFEAAAVEKIATLDGAKVNAATCWPAGFLTAPETLKLRRGLRPMETSRPSGRKLPPSRGHTCENGEHREAGP